MSQMATSASSSEKSASASVLKLRSCVVCRSRKVRCDKQLPCSNCRRANIACVFPGPLGDRPPRWAHRLDRGTINVEASRPAASQEHPAALADVMNRLRDLETIVQDFRGQLDQEHSMAQSSAGDLAQAEEVEHATPDWVSKPGSHGSPTSITGSLHQRPGRLVGQDNNRNRYVTSGFWSVVNDELDELKIEARSLDDEASDTSQEESYRTTPSGMQEFERAPSERHGFLFKHNLNPPAPDIRNLHPLPSQVPFLLDAYSENVNFIAQVVHMPTINKMARDMRVNGMMSLTPANEALLFSMYYAAVASMEDDDVMTNFGMPKASLSHKYRLGLEYALAKANFLDSPDIILVQALSIFLCLLRRHDSPRYVWMMTGLLIRMAHYLGLQRDGAITGHLTPYEIEIRRRVWWGICLLDLRASEDQGTDLTVADGSYDTKIPSNINDADIDINTQEMPQERTGVTDASFTRINAATCQIMRKMMSLSTLSGEAGSEDQNRLLDELYQEFDQSFLQDVGGSMGALYKIGVTIARLVVAKMTLIIFLPSMSSSSDEISTKERTKLLISAIEVAEYNHELNASQENRQWRWIYQTYTHWHAIVYLLIEIPRRSWSPIVERAWLALHSQWLIPSQSAMDKNLRIWVPLQKLMHKARKHRDVEIKRLRANPREAARLESEDERVPLPSSSGIFPVGDSAAMSRDHWRQLVAIPKPPEGGPRVPGAFDSESTEPSAVQSYTRQPLQSHVSIHESIDPRSNLIPNPLYSSTGGHDINQSLIPGSRDSERIVGTDMTPATELTNQTHGEIIAPEGQWPWIDSDPSFDVFPDLDAESGDIDMDFDGEVNWYELVNSAAGLERNIQTK